MLIITQRWNRCEFCLPAHSSRFCFKDWPKLGPEPCHAAVRLPSGLSVCRGADRCPLLHPVPWGLAELTPGCCVTLSPQAQGCVNLQQETDRVLRHGATSVWPLCWDTSVCLAWKADRANVVFLYIYSCKLILWWLICCWFLRATKYSASA